ncbi:MAG: rod shape-determining protein MreD [Gammaproteobacteria bacterium]|jgi:rod shape-determining protein MreD
MRANEHRGGAVILLSLLIALMLAMIPLPAWAQELRPHWMLLVLVYWSMAIPSRIGVVIAWLMGLLLDVTYDALLGQHALALAIVIFLTLNAHQRLRVYPVWQQTIVILVFCLIYDMINLWIQGISGYAPNVWLYILPSFSTAIIWPFVFLVLRRARRIYRVV